MKKSKKKSLFQRLWGENGHNSIDIRACAQKNRAELDFFCNIGQNSRLFFQFFGLKRVKCLTFNI